jgi:hypothetical protein
LNPVKATETVTAPRPELEVPTSDQVMALLVAAKGTRRAIPLLLSIAIVNQPCCGCGFCFRHNPLAPGRGNSGPSSVLFLGGLGQLTDLGPDDSHQRDVVLLLPIGSSEASQFVEKHVQ